MPGIDGFRSEDRVGQDGKEGKESGNHHLAREAEPEPEHEKRDESDLRQDLHDDNDRRERRFDPHHAAEHDTGQNSDGRTEEESELFCTG